MAKSAVGGGLLSLRFPLDESTLREAEQAAARFVNGPWNSGIPEPLGAAFNGGGPMGPAMGMPTVDPSAMPGMQVVPAEFSWVAFPGHAAAGAAMGAAMGTAMATAMGAAMMQPGAFVPAGVVSGAPLAPAPPASPQPQQQQQQQQQAGLFPKAPQPRPQAKQPAVPAPTSAPATAAPSTAPAAAPSAPTRELWSNMVEDAPTLSPPPSKAPAAQEPRTPPTVQPAGEGGPEAARETPLRPAPTSRPQAPEQTGGAEAGPAAPAPLQPPEPAMQPAAPAPAQPPAQAPATSAPRQPPNVPQPATSAPAEAPAVEAPRASAPAAAPAESPQQPPASVVASTVTGACSSPTGRSFGQLQPRSWKDIVSKDKEAEALAAASGRHASSSSTKEASRSDDARTARKDTIIDYLLFMSRYKADGKGINGHAPPDLPEELKKFHGMLEPGVNNISKAKYNRRGMKNDANNCYVNVVIQSLLPCSALMQLLSHCAQNNADRPFYTGMARLCKEFHRKMDGQEALNVLAMTQVTEIISTWQSLGAQQDAGEFLFYMLNGMHDECKWKAAKLASSTSPSESQGGAEGEDEDWAQVRAAGVHEDSPIVRIFGGLIRSSVRSQSAKGDSVSVEPFNHLILDISSVTVDSVWSALENYCGAESVNEGRATKRLQFKLLPKVLVLSLKRFSYNKDTGCPQKIKKAVKYEEKLTFDRTWLVDELEPQEYQLTAVICHIGESANGGHYNAAVRYNSDWFMYDDALVRQMTLQEVISQQWTAYLLVYQCHDKVDIRP